MRSLPAPAPHPPSPRRRPLRRIMLGVGLASAATLILVSIFGGGRADGEEEGPLVVFAILGVALAVCYFGFVGARWVWRRLMWRARRRLLVTYLFVGLTPIVLLGALVFLGAFIASAEAMARMVSSQMRSVQQRTTEGARTLAAEWESLPAREDPGVADAWLSARARLLRASLPGARLALWTGATGPGAPPGSERAPFSSLPEKGDDAPLGPDTGGIDDPLPAWLERAQSWDGYAFLPPPDEKALFGAMSVRALVRGESGGRAYALLLAVPVSRSLVHRLREVTDLEVRPYFLGSRSLAVQITDNSVRIGDPEIRFSREGAPAAVATRESGARSPGVERLDQTGEPLPQVPYFVTLNATDWTTGEPSERLAFVVKWSMEEATRHFFGGSPAGNVLRTTLLIVAATFLGLELIALIVALWMTRAVTTMVDALHAGTEHVDRGDFAHRVPVRTHDQLGDLASAFNRMSGHIEELLEERVRAERLEREVEIAAEVQSLLFPRSVPRLATATLAGACRAARGVAGDYYDFLEIAPGRLLVALGDVSGKGISASLVMSNLQAAIRAHTGVLAGGFRLIADGGGDAAEGAALSPAPGRGAVSRVASIVNEQLVRSTDTNRYATLFLALYDDRTRRLSYINAAHNAGILVRPGGEVERLSSGGTIVGSFEDAVYVEADTSLEPGALLVLFSDGVSEVTGASDEFYGEERLAALVVRNRHLDPESLQRAIFDEIDGWAAGREREDDQTLVILRGEPERPT